MKIVKFEVILSWQKAQKFALELYVAFDNLKDYEFKKQILSASISISNNIAEGFDRSSNNDFIRFLFYAISSNSEVRSMLYLALGRKYISQDQFEDFQSKSIEIARLISGLIKSLKPKPPVI